MDILVIGRIRVLLLLCSTFFVYFNGATAATLLQFDFDDGSGNFEITPEFADAAIFGMLWSDDLGLLTDFAGNPGRALAASGFPDGNTLHLALNVQPGFAVRFERIRLDLRVSASGPDLWRITDAGTTLASGGVTTSFDTVDVAIALLPVQHTVTFNIETEGASSSAGTSRIDNLELIGSVVPVALPAAFYLLATPLLGLSLQRIRRLF